MIDFSEPFDKLLTQGMVLKDGEVMSKSKGNNVPDSPFWDNDGRNCRVGSVIKGKFDVNAIVLEENYLIIIIFLKPMVIGKILLVQDRLNL